MDSRGRVLEALSQKEPDILPIDLGATDATGISAITISKLREYFGLSNEPPVKVIEPFQMLGEIKDDLREILCVDCISFTRDYNFLDLKIDTQIENIIAMIEAYRQYR